MDVEKVKWEDVFSPEFMKKHTDCGSFQELIEKASNESDIAMEAMLESGLGDL